MPRITDFNVYWCQDTEVRARAFAGWAYAHWLMGTQPQYRWRMPAHERLWTMIYRGDLGLRAARRGLIRRELMPEVLRQRLAERPDTLIIYDAARLVLIGAWKGLGAAWDWVADAWRPNANSRTA